MKTKPNQRRRRRHAIPTGQVGSEQHRHPTDLGPRGQARERHRWRQRVPGTARPAKYRAGVARLARRAKTVLSGWLQSRDRRAASPREDEHVG